MANYNFTIEGDSLVMRRTPISGDTSYKAITFKQPSLVNTLGKIRLFEAGEFQTSLIFTDFGTIGGLTPSDINDAESMLLDLLTSIGITNSFFETIIPTDTPTGIEPGFWIAVEPGTYTNFGGVVVEPNSIATISRDINGDFKISQTEFDLTEYSKLVYETPEYKIGFIDTSGNLFNNNFGLRTDLIEVTLGTVIIYTGQAFNTTLSIAGYNENKEFIEAILQSEAGVTNQRVVITNPLVKYIATAGVTGSFVLSSPYSLNLGIVKKQLEGEGKIVALSQYDFPFQKNVTLYKNQFKSSKYGDVFLVGSNTFDNLYDTKETFQTFVTSPVSAVGNLELQLLQNGKYIDKKSVQFRAVPRNTGTGQTITIVVSGDSLVDGKETACEMFRLLGVDADYDIVELGVYTATMDAVNYKHEGRGAWDWASYINPTYESTPYAGKTNAFMQGGVLNFTNYLAENFPAETNIDIFIMLLGTNDVNQGISEITPMQLNQVIENAKTFIDAFLTDFPDGHFVVGLPSIGCDLGGSTPQNVENFRYLIQQLNLLYVENFDNGAYSPNVHCVHYGSTINSLYSYNIDEQNIDDYLAPRKITRSFDNIHPLTPGFKQFGASLYYKVRGILNDFFV